MEKQKEEKESPLESPLKKSISSLNPSMPERSAHSETDELYPEKIPESQGDLADQAEIEIEQEIQEQIFRIRQRLNKDHK